MNSLHLLLLELLRMAETPVYSAFRWLGQQLGRPIALQEFVQLVDDLLEKNAIQLRAVDVDTGEAKQLHALPPDLATRYVTFGYTDGSSDPLGLSLTVGPAAEPDVEAAWEFDIDFQRGTFDLTATPANARRALGQLGRYFPDVTIVPEQTTREEGHTRIVGWLHGRDAVPSRAEAASS